MRCSARDSLTHLLFKGKPLEFCPLGVAAWRAQNRVRFVTENFSLLFSLIWTNLSQFDAPDPTQKIRRRSDVKQQLLGISLCRLHHSKLLRCVLLSCVYVSCSLTLIVSAFCPDLVYVMNVLVIRISTTLLCCLLRKFVAKLWLYRFRLTNTFIHIQQ